jgi:hypothetical protein
MGGVLRTPPITTMLSPVEFGLRSFSSAAPHAELEKDHCCVGRVCNDGQFDLFRTDVNQNDYSRLRRRT